MCVGSGEELKADIDFTVLPAFTFAIINLFPLPAWTCACELGRPLVCCMQQATQSGGTCYRPYLDRSWFISDARNHMVIDTAKRIHDNTTGNNNNNKKVFWSPMIDKCIATNWERQIDRNIPQWHPTVHIFFLLLLCCFGLIFGVLLCPPLPPCIAALPCVVLAHCTLWPLIWILLMKLLLCVRRRLCLSYFWAGQCIEQQQQVGKIYDMALNIFCVIF